MEKKKVKTRTNDAIVTSFMVVAAVIAFMGGFIFSGEIKDMVHRSGEDNKETESSEIQVAGGTSIGGITLGFNENFVVADDLDHEYNIMLGTYSGVNDAYYDIQYGNSKSEIAFVKYSYEEEDSAYYLIPFDRNVVDIHMSSFDMNAELNTIFFLLDDGTVEYILIEDAIERNDFRSFGKLEGLTNIAKFYEGTSCETESPVCTKTAFAQSTNGKIYDLYNYVH